MEGLVAMKGPLRKAINYTLKLKTSLGAFLENSQLIISNNLAERSIRPVTVRRKNWNFSTSPEGAKANAIGYSLIQTANENGLEPFRYLTWLFTELPPARDCPTSGTDQRLSPVVSVGEVCLCDDQQNSKIALISLNFSEIRAIYRCVG